MSRVFHQPRQFGFAIKQILDTAETGMPMFISDRRRSDITVTATPTGTNIKVQFTTSQFADIQGGTAHWVDWTPGVVTVATQFVMQGTVTAIRGVTTGGGGTVEVAA